MDHPAVAIIVFFVGMVLGLMLCGAMSDDYATRAMQCIVNQEHATSTDPIATCNTILNITHHHND